MAGLAGGREPGCDVRDGGQSTGVVLHVARGARRVREGVVVVHVAVRALPRRSRVRPGQRESCAVVIERSIEP